MKFEMMVSVMMVVVVLMLRLNRRLLGCAMVEGVISVIRSFSGIVIIYGGRCCN